ncbi:hypothetical protein CC2G_003201 [Coprinopsis cinerea AmutBmut pab1-1]|nr:hypothetical protein CC2G_003201 [Coprinopsis cinerea AmutBmut pab1-1]
MVHVSAKLLLAALAASPAFAAPLLQEATDEQFARDYSDFDFEARDFYDDLDVREPVSKGLWSFGKKAFTAFSGAATLGSLMAPLFSKKKKDEKKKRSFVDDYEVDAREFFEDELEARMFDGNFEYLVVRDSEDGSYHLVARAPINPASLLKIGKVIGKGIGAIKKHSKWAIPAIGGAGFGVG